MNYKDPLTERIIKLFTDNKLPVKTYHRGPIFFAPAKNELPFLAVINTTEGMSRRGTRQTETTFAFALRLITDFTTGIDKRWDVSPGYMRLKELIAARDSDYGLKTPTIFNILDSNKRLEETANLYILNDILANYTNPLAPLPGDIYTTEATVTFSLNLEATSGDA